MKFSAKASAVLYAEHETSMTGDNIVEADENADTDTGETEKSVPEATSSPGPSTSDFEKRITQAIEAISAALTVTCRSEQTNSGGIHKWNLKYNGDANLSSFLQRIDELRQARGVSKSQLFASAVELFSGPALIWYRSKKNTIESWDDLVIELKRTFLPWDYELSLKDEIRDRTQGSDEKVAVFIAKMQGLFDRLPEKPSERVRIAKIKRNLQPYLQRQVIRDSFDTVAELDELCCELEAAEAHTQRFKNPPSVNQALEPDLAYHRPRPAPKVFEAQSHPSLLQTQSTLAQADVVDQSTAQPSLRSGLTCWNCQSIGHRSVNCPEPPRMHCFRCGKPNVTSRSCPRCSGNAPRRQ